MVRKRYVEVGLEANLIEARIVVVDSHLVDLAWIQSARREHLGLIGGLALLVDNSCSSNGECAVGIEGALIDLHLQWVRIARIVRRLDVVRKLTYLTTVGHIEVLPSLVPVAGCCRLECC